MELVASGEIL